MEPNPLPLVMLAMEVKELVLDLGEWPQVGALAETLLGAAAGHDSMSDVEVRQMRNMARRWGALHRDIKAFYAEAVFDSESASVGLWHILQGTPHLCTGPTCGSVYRLYRAWNGVDSCWTLFPRIK